MYAARAEKPGTGNGEDLRNAIDEVLQCHPFTTPVTKVFGCSIKWSWKSDYTNKNFIFTDNNVYKLIEAVDNEWQGALPFTMLIEPCGKILYKKQDMIDPHETHMIDQNTNTYEYNSLSTERSELDEVNHVWFHPTFKIKIIYG